jgi:hypothetical protein
MRGRVAALDQMRGNIAIPRTLEKSFWFRPATKREADVLALKLFCLFSFILLGLITSGVL